jgi:predicted nucleic acid-binding protein
MTTVLVDSNVILDVLTDDPVWGGWSARHLATCADRSVIAINPIIYAEVSIGFATIEALEEALPRSEFRRLALPWEAGFLAGKCFVRYRKQGGARVAPLPDFYIGAHAAISGLTLMTRDAARYRSYFPKVPLICPS